MAEPVLLIDRAGGVATLTLNRPQALNALSRELCHRLRDAFVELPRAGDVDVLILTGAGRAFCAGLDLKELGGETSGRGELAAAVGGGDESLLDTMARCPLPIIGAINGFAITGGFELALGCDVLIASSEARFADTHARVGIMPGWGLSQKLSRAVGMRVVVRDDRLGVRSPTANPVAAAALTAAIERVAAERVASVSARLAEAARTALDRGGRPTREKLARVLGMSGTTLARRLEAEQRRFRNVVDEVRRARACGLVADGRLDLSEVAARVGFADLAAFGKAFRRWFGTSPSAYRALARRPATPAG